MNCKNCGHKLEVSKPLAGGWPRKGEKQCQVCGTLNCKWARFCEHCEAELTAHMTCVTCKELLPTSAFYRRHDHDRKIKDRYRAQCRVCERNRKNSRDKFNNKELHAMFANALIKDILEGLPTEPLTETQWLKTCQYFKGCSICGKNDIQLRNYLIPRSKGGRYVVGNMLPLCGVCANSFRLQSPINAFYLMQIRENKLSMDRLDKIYDFIKGKKYEQF
jgi:hypothetical protein